MKHAAGGAEGGRQLEKILVPSLIWPKKAVGDRHAAERQERLEIAVTDSARAHCDAAAGAPARSVPAGFAGPEIGDGLPEAGIQADTLAPGLECVLYENSHTPGHQCVYVETEKGTAAIVGDIARKVDLNIEQAIPPGIYYDLEKMRRALEDIGRRADVILPTHDWDTLERAKIG